MSNLKETYKRVKIEGILAENNIDYITYTNRNGESVRAIGGDFQVLVRTSVDGIPKDLMIPVHVFSNELTKTGEKNKSFLSIEKVKNEFISIAAAGGEEKATKVRLTTDKIGMNEYYDGTGRLVSYPRISASFVSVATGNFNPEASFEIVMAVDGIREVLDNEGVPVEPQKLAITGSIVQYNGDVDCIELVTSSPSAITGIRDYWNIGDTVKAIGILNFSYSVVEVKNNDSSIAFGAPAATKKQTRRISELMITSGTSPFEGDLAIDKAELTKGKAERLVRLEELKAKGNKPKATPAPSASINTDDLGF